ncbi:MAG: glycerol kinase, partial [Lachnospiraceae bacterium]|nr:glycerol kinase [Lachnospiraceae bacterium]
GAAFLAGLAVEFFKDKDEIRFKWELGREFKPCDDREYADKCMKGWHKAVKCALSWSDDKD